MAHLYKFRKGWENENLARFILSRFSFIAHPATVADDIGSDFYCTLFKKLKHGRNDILLPKNAFVIQIKSSLREVDLSMKAEFLKNLELPYFFGIADRKKMSLSIYSGRGLDLLFTMEGNPSKLVAQFRAAISDRTYYEISNRELKHYKLNFPFITEVKANAQDQEIERVYALMAEECALIYQNIASRRRHEFILTFSPSDTRIFAGPGSNTQFRRNFLFRLAEYFYNLEWVHRNQRPLFSNDEFSRFGAFWEIIRQDFPESEKSLVQDVYVRLAAIVQTTPRP